MNTPNGKPMLTFDLVFHDEARTIYRFNIDDGGYETPESICSLTCEAITLTGRDYDVQRVEPEVEPEPSWWQRFWASNVSKDWS